MNAIRFGIIGAGMISHFHAKAINDAVGAELVSVMSTGAKRREEFAAKHGVKSYADLGEFLADPKLDAVAVATPSGAHRDAAVAAAKAGKHIMCEKPLEITPERACDIVDACRDNNVVLAPIFQYRHSPAAGLIREAARSGRFGRLLMGNARIKWFRPQSYYDADAWRGTALLDGGGCLMNQSIHAIDLLLHFMGAASEVYGYADTTSHERIGVEDNAAAVVRFANGAVGVIESSTSLAPGWPLRVEVSGTRGTAAISAGSLSKWDFVDNDPLDEKAAALLGETAAPGGANDPAAIDATGHRRTVEDMVRAVNTGSPTLVGAEDAIAPVRLVCGIYEVRKTGRPVVLSDGI